MTAGEVIDFIKILMRNEEQGVPADQEMLVLLNIAQNKLSVDLSRPTRTAKAESVSDAFPMPTEANAGGLLWVKKLDNQDEVKILTVDDANLLHPNWHNGESRTGKDFVVYDPSNISAPLYPVPSPTSENYLLQYVKKPDRVTDLTDNVFDNELQEHHTLLAYYVAFLLTQSQLFLGMYQSELAEASAYVLSSPIRPVSDPVYDVFFNGRRNVRRFN